MYTAKCGIIIHIMGYYNSGRKTLCDILYEKLSHLTKKKITYIDDVIKKSYLTD